MRSMTGYGEAVAKWRGCVVKVEARSVNHKFFNLKLNLPELLTDYESEIEKIVRNYVQRGVVNLSVKLDTITRPEPFQLNPAVLRHYYQHLRRFQRLWRIKEGVRLETLLNLPGVVEPVESDNNVMPGLWNRVSRVLKSALHDLVRMRQREAQRLNQSLIKGIREISNLSRCIKNRAPLVVTRYRKQIQTRLKQLLKGYTINISNQPGLITELALIAQRCDITEEINRLNSHLTEFQQSLNHRTEVGKRLDFITQEMLRETNTIAAKANDVQITHWTIDLKNEIEKIKEQVQNIE